MRSAVASLIACLALAVLATCGDSGPGPSKPPPPPPVNTPPQIRSLTASDARAEADVPLTLTAVVEDAETPVANLEYAWGAAVGTFVGTGPRVTWIAGQTVATPADVLITLTVTERFTSGTTQGENRVTSTTSVRLHNSPRELRDMSLRFLGDFANSRVSPEQCVSEFSDSCSGKSEELADVQRNRHDYEILSSSLRHTSLSIAGNRLTATVHTACSFTSKVITNQVVDPGCQNCKLGDVGSTSGDCVTTNVYERGRWWLCTSSYVSPNGAFTAWERAFFGIRGAR